MNLCRIAHTLADLAVDAIEAIIHAPHSDRAADDLWARAADGLADAEAEYEVAEGLGEYVAIVGFPPHLTYQMWEDSRWCIFQFPSGNWGIAPPGRKHDSWVFPTFEEARAAFAAGAKP